MDIFLLACNFGVSLSTITYSDYKIEVRGGNNQPPTTPHSRKNTCMPKNHSHNNNKNN